MPCDLKCRCLYLYLYLVCICIPSACIGRLPFTQREGKTKRAVSKVPVIVGSDRIKTVIKKNWHHPMFFLYAYIFFYVPKRSFMYVTVSAATHVHNSYLWTFDFYSHVRIVFDEGRLRRKNHLTLLSL
jgi:hypothetical protein